MLKTTLSTLKKACLSWSFAPRLIRGDTRHSLGKFHKLSIIVLRKAEKSTESGKEKDAECEKCKKLIELIFGPTIPPDVIQGIQKSEFPEADVHHINEIHKENIETTSEKQVVYSEPCGKENASIDFQLHATTAKEKEEQLAQKVEIINETPLVEAEKPVIDGFNVPSKVLSSAVDTCSAHKLDRIKLDDYDDKVQSNREETRRLEDFRSLEDIRSVKQHLPKETVRSKFKLPINNFASDRQNRKSGASAETNHPYDELAKRCLDAPSSKIDERLLEEMEKLGVPQTSPRRESSVIEENIIQIDVLKKPRKPVKKKEIDLEAREFERDPPIAYVSKLHPAFQMANVPKTISEDDIDSTTLKSERIQLYELDKKPLTYSENRTAYDPVEIDSPEDSKNFEPRPDYDPNVAIIDPYDKKTLVYENCEEEYDPFWYQKYSVPLNPIQENVRYPHTSDMESDEARNNAAIQILAANCSSQTGPITTSDSSIDQAKEQAEPYITFESHPLDHASDGWQFSEQPQTMPDNKATPEKPSETSQLKAVTPESTFKKHTNETIQLSIQIIDPHIPESPSDENTKKTGNEIYQYYTSNKPATPLDSNISKAYFIHYSPNQNKSNTPKHPSKKPQMISPSEPTASMRNVSENYLSYTPKAAIPSETDKLTLKSFQYSTPSEPAKETFHYSTPPEPAAEAAQHLAPAKETIQYSNRPEPVKETIQYLTPSEPTKESIQSTYNTFTSERANETFHYSTASKPAEETFKYSTPPEPAKEAFQYSTPPEPAVPSGTSIEKADVTYIEPNVSEKLKIPETNERKNPAITPEQISHSFVQPQAMVNPLVDRRTLREPADKMQKTMSSACGPIPKVKLSEELSLSEMLKRVRMRNRMEFCQAYDRQMDPVTGKCGKKTPPCPPPAPKCPQNPPPSCPPAPPPCPKPCKPACPPPCPPPCPPKNPCQKFKNFPGIDLKKLITLLLQPDRDIQKSVPNLCVQISERSRAALTKEMSHKLQEIGINLLIAYPRMMRSAESVSFAKDYEPWVPIPSWPIPKKEKKRPFVCPKDGCKLIPPPKLRPACTENPCVQFPKRTNSFSIANLLSFAIGEYVEFDILD